MSSITRLFALFAVLAVGLASPLPNSPPPKSTTPKSPPPKSPPPKSTSPKSPPPKSPPPQSCGCLTSWRYNNDTWSGCLYTGWCSTSTSCASPTGYADNGGGVEFPWIYCDPKRNPPSSLRLKPPPPSPLPPPKPSLRSPLPPKPFPKPSGPSPHPPLSPPPAGSGQPCECLKAWRYGNNAQSGCRSDGWCATSNSCASPEGYGDGNFPWIFCDPLLYPPPSRKPLPSPPSPPPFPPGSQPCGFYRRTEDSDLINRTGGIQIWTCLGHVVPQAVRIARRYSFN